jgi:hypothetical protein
MTPAPLQVAPLTPQPYEALVTPRRPEPREASPDDLGDKAENELTGSASEESQETTTSTIVTTTVITTEQAPGARGPAVGDRDPTATARSTWGVLQPVLGPNESVLSALCSVTFTDPEGFIDSNDYPPLPSNNFLECTYNVTVYTGYGVELQVTRGDCLGAVSRCHPGRVGCLFALIGVILAGL